VKNAEKAGMEMHIKNLNKEIGKYLHVIENNRKNTHQAIITKEKRLTIIRRFEEHNRKREETPVLG